MGRADATQDEEDDVCGIAGWVGFDQDLRTQTSTVDAMTQTMACRGPDDEGTFVAPSFTWRPNEDTSLTLLSMYQKDNVGQLNGS